MNAREKEQYLREYQILKNQGKPFFPYAVYHDGVMAIVTMLVIILMTVLFGAELGPKADATTTTFVPRPEWYFFFLFELLRVVEPPSLVFLATIGIPTICLVALLLLPFVDRNPERHPAKRPVATLLGIVVIGAMGYLTYEGAVAGSPTEIELTVSPQYEEGKTATASSGCLGCHRFGENGNPGPGPDLSAVGQRLPSQAIARTLVNPTAPMPSYAKLQTENPDRFNAIVDFLASLK